MRAFGPRWVATSFVFLIVVEGLTFIPYIGFVVKLAVASLLVAQWLLMCADADAGEPPRLATLLGAFAWPMSSQGVLVLAGVVPFAVGIVFLAAARGGWAGVEFFFGHMTANGAAVPGPASLLAFKLVMAVVGMATVFIPGTIALLKSTGPAALRIALHTAILNWRVMLFAFGIDVGFELVEAGLSAIAPSLLAALVSIVSLLAYLAWNVLFTYAISIRALAVPAASRPAAADGH